MTTTKKKPGPSSPLPMDKWFSRDRIRFIPDRRFPPSLSVVVVVVAAAYSSERRLLIFVCLFVSVLFLVDRLVQ